jgi:hypothetical protein
MLSSCLLWKQKICGAMPGEMVLPWSSTVNFPIPQGEDEDVESPQQGRSS